MSADREALASIGAALDATEHDPSSPPTRLGGIEQLTTGWRTAKAEREHDFRIRGLDAD